MGNVVSLLAAREMKEAEDLEYRAKILGMDKLELLDEMVRFQEERSRIGSLTPSLIMRGRILFKALEENAETRELQLLTSSYRRHLEYEHAAYIQDKANQR